MERVLIIDDEPMVRDLMAQALARAAFCVDSAADAFGGIAKFQSRAYDLVITDVCMPGMDGIGVLRHIRRSDRSRTPVIGVSGTPALLHDGGFDAVLPKPFALQALIDKAIHMTRIGVAERVDVA